MAWKQESYPGEIDGALDLFSRRDGEIFAYEMQQGTLRRLEDNSLARRISGNRFSLLPDGWAEVFRRRTNSLFDGART